MAAVRAHVYITGYVQGVFYRHSAAQRARVLSLAGWIRNLADGRVEAVFEGDESDVRSMVEWCRSGPPHATVEAVETTWEAPTAEFSGFSAV